jgi:DNA mismatch endonuclease (patch repair protein)
MLLTTPERSRLMARIGAKNTAPELAVRRPLHGLGFRFRLHQRDLPGRPDIVLPRWSVVVLVHGCFWHSCPHCAKGTRRPATNVEFWDAKLDRNNARDAEVETALRDMGWRVLTVWECRARKPDVLVEDLGPLFALRVSTDTVADGELRSCATPPLKRPRVPE